MNRAGLYCSLVLVLTVATNALGQEPRPSAMKLFPAETMVFLRASNLADLRDRFEQSSGGQMLNDPAISPFVQDFIDTAKSRFDEEVAEEAGFESSDLNLLPNGEAAFGLVDTGASEPVVVVLFDFGDNADAAPELLDKVLAKAESDGATVITEPLANDELTVIRPGDNADESFGYVMRQGCMIGSNDQPLLESICLARWDSLAYGAPLPAPEVDPENPDEEPVGTRSLAENQKFVTILRECSTQLSEPPQVVFFVDPLQIMQLAGRSNGGLRVFMAIFPALGIDGFEAIGGTVSLSTTEWDSLVHAHVLLENPRSGVINLIRFRETDHAPPGYIPLGVDQYASTAVDPLWLFDEIAKLHDTFRYDGAFRELVQDTLSDEWEIDFEEEILPHLTGRVITATGYEWPVDSFTGQHRLVAVPFNSGEEARRIMDHFAERYDSEFREEDLGGVTYWRLGPEDRDREQRRRRPPFFTPAIAAVDDTVVISTSENLLQQCIEAHTGTRDRLADAIEYRLIQSRIDRMTRGRQLSMLQFDRPEQAMRYWYDMVAEGTAGEMLGDSENATAMEFRDLLDRHDLPPFDVLSKYLAPGGGFLMDTDTGFHYMAFGMRREVEAEQ